MKKIILILLSIFAFMLVAVNIYYIIDDYNVTASAEIDIDINTTENYNDCYLIVPLSTASTQGGYVIGSLFLQFSSSTCQITIFQINGFLGSSSASSVLNLTNLSSLNPSVFYVNCRTSAGGQSPMLFYYSAQGVVTLNSDFDMCEISVASNGTIRYYFYNTSNSADFYNFYISSYSDNPFTLTYTTLINVSIHYNDIATLTENAFNNGYFRGEMIGYENGYTDGLNTYLDGHGMFNIFVNSVNDFFQIEIIENVTISNILAIGFGVILLGLCIKIFLGG